MRIVRLIREFRAVRWLRAKWRSRMQATITLPIDPGTQCGWAVVTVGETTGRRVRMAWKLRRRLRKAGY